VNYFREHFHAGEVGRVAASILYVVCVCCRLCSAFVCVSPHVFLLTWVSLLWTCVCVCVCGHVCACVCVCVCVCVCPQV
jgi:hypothetical protein